MRGLFCRVEQHSPARPAGNSRRASATNVRVMRRAGCACLSRCAKGSRPKRLAVRHVRRQQGASAQRSRQHHGAPAQPPTALCTTHRGARRRDFGGGVLRRSQREALRQLDTPFHLFNRHRETRRQKAEVAHLRNGEIMEKWGRYPLNGEMGTLPLEKWGRYPLFLIGVGGPA